MAEVQRRLQAALATNHTLRTGTLVWSVLGHSDDPDGSLDDEPLRGPLLTKISDCMATARIIELKCVCVC